MDHRGRPMAREICRVSVHRKLIDEQPNTFILVFETNDELA
jgi:hypothetical protein